MYKKIFKEIKKYDTIVIARHIGPDPDALSSQIALRDSIKLTFPEKKVYAVGTGSAKFSFIGHLDKMEDVDDALLITCDTPDLKRVDIPDISKFKHRIKIDHHPFVEKYCDLELIEDFASSACEVIMRLILNTNLKCNKSIAEVLFIGLVSDSNRFLFDSCSSETFSLVSKYLATYKFDISSLYEKLYLRPLSEVRFHGYIEQKINESGISHAEIEVEFDRELMIMDKKNSITQSLVRHIIPSEENAKVISEFYPGTTMQEVKKALEGMISYNNLLVAPSHLKRWFIYLLLKLSGNYKEMHGLIVNYHKNKECNDSTVKLLSLYRHAKNTAYQSIIKFDGFLNNDCELDKAFNYSFGSVLIEGCDNNQKQCISDNIQNVESFIKKEVQYEG